MDKAPNKGDGRKAMTFPELQIRKAQSKSRSKDGSPPKNQKEPSFLGPNKPGNSASHVNVHDSSEEKSPHKYKKQQGFLNTEKLDKLSSDIHDDGFNELVMGHDQVGFTDEDSDEDEDFKEFKKSAGLKDINRGRVIKAFPTKEKGNDRNLEKVGQLERGKETVPVAPNFAAFAHFMANPSASYNVGQAKRTSPWTNMLDAFKMLHSTAGGEQPKRLGADGENNL